MGTRRSSGYKGPSCLRTVSFLDLWRDLALRCKNNDCGTKRLAAVTDKVCKLKSHMQLTAEVFVPARSTANLSAYSLRAGPCWPTNSIPSGSAEAQSGPPPTSTLAAPLWPRVPMGVQVIKQSFIGRAGEADWGPISLDSHLDAMLGSFSSHVRASYLVLRLAAHSS